MDDNAAISGDRLEGTAPLRIASWSGPRNISTAMLRSWGNRSDSAVSDEPLYAHYLLEHGLDHPGREEIIDHHEERIERVIEWLSGPAPGGRRVWYQKHMSHHLVDTVPRDWLFAGESDEGAGFVHMFLIREPEEMLTSLMQVIPSPGILDTGLPQQVELWRMLREHGQDPPILDAVDALSDPRGHLELLCERLGVPFEEAMLRWPAGRRETDGIWAKHWYGAVEKSTGFQTYRPKGIPVPVELTGVLEEAQELYEELAAHRLRLAQG